MGDTRRDRLASASGTRRGLTDRMRVVNDDARPLSTALKTRTTAQSISKVAASSPGACPSAYKCQQDRSDFLEMSHFTFRFTVYVVVRLV